MGKLALENVHYFQESLLLPRAVLFLWFGFFFLLPPGSLNASFFYEEHIVFLLISCTRFILLQGYVVNI